jgi:anti-anti-sigma regulatory factor
MSQSLTSQSLTSESLLDRFDLSADDLALLKECGRVIGDKIDGVVDRFYEWLGEQPEFNVFFSSKDTVERVKKLQKVYWVDFFNGVVDERYVDYRVHIGEIAEFAKRRVIESGKAMLAMSTPVSSIWDGILLLPLVGIVDSQRTQDIMEKTLSRIVESRARVFVMDISGVVTVDTAVANNFIRITQATRLMGCDCIISGISPSVARTLVELGANVGEVCTTATLRDALQLALATIEPTVRDSRASNRTHAEVMHR